MDRNNVPFCTCADTKCPFHPSNHDKGCTPCIAKNLREREIPTCFFRAAGGRKASDGWRFEDFAALFPTARDCKGEVKNESAG